MLSPPVTYAMLMLLKINGSEDERKFIFSIYIFCLFAFSVRVPPKKYSFTPKEPVLLKAIFKFVKIMIYI